MKRKVEIAFCDTNGCKKEADDKCVKCNGDICDEHRYVVAIDQSVLSKECPVYSLCRKCADDLEMEMRL